jgi:HSP20 family protein
MKFGVMRRDRSLDYGLNGFRNEISSFFDDFLSFNPLSLHDNEWTPQIDVSDEGNAISVKAEMPGLSENDIKVTVENGFLSISGEKSNERTNDKGNYIVAERRFGSFTRSFKLPDGIRSDEINAEFKNGILTVEIPKDEKSISKKIEIKAN